MNKNIANNIIIFFFIFALVAPSFSKFLSMYLFEIFTIKFRIKVERAYNILFARRNMFWFFLDGDIFLFDLSKPETYIMTGIYTWMNNDFTELKLFEFLLNFYMLYNIFNWNVIYVLV